jgi:hypothetical protein
MFIGLAVAIVAIYAGYEASRTQGKEERLGLVWGAVGLAAAAAVLVWLGWMRPASDDPLLPQLTQPVNLKMAMGVAFAVGGGLAALAALQRARTLMFGSFWVLALSFTLWFNWSHWVSLSHHWTQRDQFWRYYALRKPGEPIAAYLMNWRGETFYSRNTVKQIRDPARMGAYARLPGRKWSLVEHYRLNLLKNAVGPDKVITPVARDLNNKFVLVTID